MLFIRCPDVAELPVGSRSMVEGKVGLSQRIAE